MLLVSVGMLCLGLIGLVQQVANSVLYVFFGGFGAFMSIRDFQLFKSFKEKKNAWLVSHLGRMVGALIASVTAFLVAGIQLGSTLVWIMPTIVGTVYIIYSNRALNKSKVLRTDLH
jgi:peptidoglycan/LPS O-acetylase OafA/YrhL